MTYLPTNFEMELTLLSEMYQMTICLTTEVMQRTLTKCSQQGKSVDFLLKMLLKHRLCANT